MKKYAIVTGAVSGIGKSIAEALAGEGHNVVVADMDKDKGLSVADKIGGLFVNANLSEQTSCRNLVDSAAEKYGSIDILLNNAGFQHVAPL